MVIKKLSGLLDSKQKKRSILKSILWESMALFWCTLVIGYWTSNWIGALGINIFLYATKVIGLSQYDYFWEKK